MDERNDATGAPVPTAVVESMKQPAYFTDLSCIPAARRKGLVVHAARRRAWVALEYLASAEVADFSGLENALGALSVQQRKLEGAGSVAIEKPLTRVRLTPAGRKAFKDDLDVIGKLIEENKSQRASRAREALFTAPSAHDRSAPIS